MTPMTPQDPSIPTRGRSRRALAVAAAALLLAVACGDDDDTSTATTTTTVADDPTTTSAPDDETEVDDEEESGDLLALLPDVSAIDAGYTEAPAEDEEAGGDDEVEDALAEACPEAAAILAEDDDEDDSAEREYDGALAKSVTVGLDPTPRNLDEDSIDDAVAAVASCETVTLTQDGLDMTIDLTAERDDTYGDRGVLMTMDLSISSPQLPAPITLQMRGRIFQVGSLGASVNVTSGFDETTFEPAPGDFELLDPLAAQLESAAASHGG